MFSHTIEKNLLIYRRLILMSSVLLSFPAFGELRENWQCSKTRVYYLWEKKRYLVNLIDGNVTV